MASDGRTRMVAVPRSMESFLRGIHGRRTHVRFEGKVWLIDRFSIGSPPDVMIFTRSDPPTGAEVVDLDAGVEAKAST